MAFSGYLTRKYGLIFIQQFEKQNVLINTEYTSSHPYLTRCPHWGNLPLKLEMGPLYLFRHSLMRFLIPVRQSAECPVITVNSGKTRKPPELRLKAGFIHSGCFFTFFIGSESYYLPNQRTNTAKECNPCKAQGHMGFSNQKSISQCRGAWDISTAQGQNKNRARVPTRSAGAGVGGRRGGCCHLN